MKRALVFTVFLLRCLSGRGDIYDQVLNMSHTLLNGSFTAGAKYPEIWIRDLNTFIFTSLDVNSGPMAKEALEGFFIFQKETGNVPDGWIPDTGNPGYTHYPWYLDNCISLQKLNANYEECAKACNVDSQCNSMKQDRNNCETTKCSANFDDDKLICPGKDGGHSYVRNDLTDKRDCLQNRIFTPCQGAQVVCKNTVATDQESSLVGAVYQYILHTGDSDYLDYKIFGLTVLQRLQKAIEYLQNFKTDPTHRLLTGATTYDWGDVQFEDRSVLIDQKTHLSIDAYDNALYMTALQQLIEMGKEKIDVAPYQKLWSDTKNQIRKLLWTGDKFKPHVYINGSCLGSGYNESVHYFHGGTTIAMIANVLSREEVLHVYNAMKANVEKRNKNGSMTIGMTIYPAYSNAPCMSQKPYTYQNGGDWTWFGARTVQALLQHNYTNEALETFAPIIDRVVKNNGFWEWWDQNGQPQGSRLFRGSAGVVGKAIHMLKARLKGANTPILGELV